MPAQAIRENQKIGVLIPLNSTHKLHRNVKVQPLNKNPPSEEKLGSEQGTAALALLKEPGLWRCQPNIRKSPFSGSAMG
jgi:hypothetical protein